MSLLLSTTVAFLLAGTAGRQPVASGLSPQEVAQMRDLAVTWLHAFAIGDPRKLLSASEPTLSVYGFDMMTGKSRRKCAEEFPGRRVGNSVQLGGTGATPDGNERLAACVVEDKVARAGLCDGECVPKNETIEVMKPSTVRRALKRYGKAVASLPSGIWLRMPRQEKDGVSLSALVLVSSHSKEKVAVRAVILESKFTE